MDYAIQVSLARLGAGFGSVLADIIQVSFTRLGTGFGSMLTDINKGLAHQTVSPQSTADIYI